MNDENWNGRVPLFVVSFDDAKLKVIENSMGVCYEPQFKSSKDYAKVKEFIQDVLGQITDTCKDDKE